MRRSHEDLGERVCGVLLRKAGPGPRTDDAEQIRDISRSFGPLMRRSKDDPVLGDMRATVLGR